jgi:hypothetical protein
MRLEYQAGGRRPKRVRLGAKRRSIRAGTTIVQMFARHPSFFVLRSDDTEAPHNTPGLLIRPATLDVINLAPRTIPGKAVVAVRAMIMTVQKSACQSANFQMIQYVRTILAANRISVLLRGSQFDRSRCERSLKSSLGLALEQSCALRSDTRMSLA